MLIDSIVRTSLPTPGSQHGLPPIIDTSRTGECRSLCCGCGRACYRGGVIVVIGQKAVGGHCGSGCSGRRTDCRRGRRRQRGMLVDGPGDTPNCTPTTPVERSQHPAAFAPDSFEAHQPPPQLHRSIPPNLDPTPPNTSDHLTSQHPPYNNHLLQVPGSPASRVVRVASS